MSLTSLLTACILIIISFFLDEFGKYILVIALIILFEMIIKYIYETKKYGKPLNPLKRFSFTINTNSSKKETLFIQLDKMTNPKKIYDACNFNCDIILIHNTGIYLIKQFTYEGQIKGSTNDNEWVNKVTSLDTFKITNPIIEIKKDVEKIKNIIDIKYIENVLILSNLSITKELNINDKKTKVYKAKDFYLEFKEYLNNRTSILNKEQIKIIYKNIKCVK